MCQFSGKTDNIDLFGPNLTKMDFGSEIQKNNVRIRISILEIPFVRFSSKNDNLDFFGPNLPKNELWGRSFENLSSDSESAPPVYDTCQFSVKMDHFEFFGLNLGILPNYVQYFGYNNVKGVAES